MMNSVHSLPTNLPILFIPSVIPLVKMTRHYFFWFVLIFFPSVYTEGVFPSVKSLGNISVGKIPWKFTDGNIHSVFPFVFIDILVMVT